MVWLSSASKDLSALVAFCGETRKVRTFGKHSAAISFDRPTHKHFGISVVATMCRQMAPSCMISGFLAARLRSIEGVAAAAKASN